MTSTAEYVARIQPRYQLDIDAIRADATRTEEWKRQQLAKVYVKMRRDVQDHIEKEAALQASRTRMLHARVFGTVGLPGDPGSLAISRRDASDRAANLKNQDDAMDLLDRATRTGDETLARAIAERALERNWVHAANAFLETRPALNDALNELWNAREGGGVQDRFETGMAVAGLVPKELAGLSPYAIEQMAERSDSPVGA